MATGTATGMATGMATGAQRCSNCTKHLSPGHFTSNHKVFKTCTACRAKVARYDAKNKNRKRKYYAANADKKREYQREYRAANADKIRENQREYRAANADKKREYKRKHYAANADKIRENKRKHYAANADKICGYMRTYNATNATYRIRRIKKDAAQRGYEYALADEHAEALLRGACEYCGHKDDDAFNGIDRVDNSRGYVAGNCVSACWTCNRMKGTDDVAVFRQRCAHISGFATCADAFPDKPHGGQYAIYVNDAPKRQLAFELSKDEFKALTAHDCEYCGKPSTATHTNGLDRVDNSRGYVADNVVPCCGTCNIMKHAMNLHEFKTACTLVALKL